MNPKILILTQPGDVHAYAVALALSQRGAEAILWHTTDFPTRSGESLMIDRDLLELEIQSPHVALPPSALVHITTVWRRRPGTITGESLLHPADRKFSEIECGMFRKGLVDHLAPHAFWVNPQRAAVYAESKPTQHSLALQSGLLAPRTLYSNDPNRIRGFLRDHPEGVIYKPFRGTSWRKGSIEWASYTSIVRESDLVDDEILRLTPGIFQVLVPKAHELRVTIMGREIFSVRLLSQETTRGRLDWRRSPEELKMEECALPESVAQACIRLMESLGLVFGCLDFIVTPSGDYVFLEINEMGQFLFLERYTGLPLLESFVEFLCEGSPGFRFERVPGSLRYEDISSKAQALAEQAKIVHVTIPEEQIPDDVEVNP